MDKFICALFFLGGILGLLYIIFFPIIKKVVHFISLKIQRNSDLKLNTFGIQQNISKAEIFDESNIKLTDKPAKNINKKNETQSDILEKINKA